ncbi:hypothetical protein PFICI_01274 [Pestalotiopsis fici W106-1]|uniref:AB hydrolase-1 domain-containing protein n=1 Tax=Pestalotiopsis fici (strain W106-1 / CGMCC3.15140) TaxID=1229662 RepID=W3XQB1_PESFW|nr:uncharacterized protein PFICI_01274 [Pestalotiopsis fici W106-1]ETS87446.1 hypothetical protein PFICI_01274 [Pestalotiopsis fici W106-1]
MTATSTPSRPMGIILVHGGFHLPSCFDKPKARLEAAGFSPVLAVRHPSVGRDPKVTVEDDARNIQAEMEPYLDQGIEFLAVSHSYGGAPLTIAAKGYSVAERAAQHKTGGIRAVVYLTSNVVPKAGASALSPLPPLDIVEMGEGLMWANEKAKAAFYGPDMAGDEADRCMAVLLPQSMESLLGGVSVGVDELTVSAYYIICEKDQTIPVRTQEEMIATIPTLKRVLRNPGGHTAFITEMGKFVEQIIEIADEVEKDFKA